MDFSFYGQATKNNLTTLFYQVRKKNTKLWATLQIENRTY